MHTPKQGVKNWNFTQKQGQDFQVPAAGPRHDHMLLPPSPEGILKH